MPNTTSAYFTNLLPLLTGGPDPDRQSSAFQRFTSTLYCVYVPGVAGVDHANLDVIIRHYVAPEDSLPVEGSMCFCSGTLKAERAPGENLPTIHVQALRLLCFPGDVHNDDYEQRCPPPNYAEINVVGLVGRHEVLTQPDGGPWNAVEVNLHVYDPSRQAVPLTVWVVIPPSRRWEKTRVPRPNALINAMGFIIGVKTDTRELMMELKNLDYVNTRGTEAATRASLSESPVAPTTPNKRQRWSAYQLPSPTTFRQRGSRPEVAPPNASADPPSDMLSLTSPSVASSETAEGAD